MEREYIVTCKTREDLESLYEDLETPGGSLYIPDRAVECVHKRPISRNTHYNLTEEEAESIKNDDRVLDVELCGRELGIEIKPAYEISGNISNTSDVELEDSPNYVEATNRFSKTNNCGDTFINWALLRCVNGQQISRWGSDDQANAISTNVTHNVRVTGSGKNVDVVIVDGCIDPDHPEFNSNPDGSSGTSRVVQYNWLQHRADVEGTSNGTYVYTPYIDVNDDALTVDNNHGCHVAGTACGNRRGWARDANIYNINLYSTAPTSLGGSSNNSDFVFDYIRAWHNSKPVNSETGRKNPTITNNSWGSSYTIPVDDITSVNFRGTTINKPGGGWSQTELANYGLIGYFIDTQDNNTPKVSFPALTSALQADIDDCVGDGILFVGAAGNDSHKSTISGDVDYNNSVSAYSLTLNYHRGSQPAANTNVISVGNISSLVEESKVTSSTCGNRIDVYAPGDRIISSTHNSRKLVNGSYINDSFTRTDGRSSGTTYTLSKYGGTSMASPQVTGSLACFLEIWPRMSQADAIDWIKNYSNAADQITDYGDDTLTYGVTNNSSSSYTFSGDATGSNPTLTVTEGDVLVFNVNVGIHDFWIKTAQTTGSGDGVTTGTITNNGQGSTGTITWDTRGVTPGEYYYICELHFAMKGIITVQPDYTRYDSLQGSDNKYFIHKNARLYPYPVNASQYWYGGTTTTQITEPRGKFKSRPSSGRVYPRTDVWKRIQ